MTVERQEIFVPRNRRNQSCIVGLIFDAAVDRVVEVRGDLEKIVEVRVELVQVIVEVTLADQDHLDIERYRLGFQRRRADETQ